MQYRPNPAPALAELMEKERQAKLGGWAGEFAVPPSGAPTPRPAAQVRPPDWHQEAAQAEADARAPLRTSDPPHVQEHEEAGPAKPRPKSTPPRLDVWESLNFAARVMTTSPRPNSSNTLPAVPALSTQRAPRSPVGR